ALLARGVGAAEARAGADGARAAGGGRPGHRVGGARLAGSGAPVPVRRARRTATEEVLMRLTSLLDPIADALLALRGISPVQWALRGTGTAATVAAAALALSGPGLAAMHLGVVLVGLVCLTALAAQWLDPDTDLGMLAPTAVVIALAVRADLDVVLAGSTGLLLLAGHASFALAAVMPAHGALDRDALRLALRALTGVLVLTLVGGVLVVLLAQVQLGPWAVVVAAVAVVVLWIALMPRG